MKDENFDYMNVQLEDEDFEYIKVQFWRPQDNCFGNKEYVYKIDINRLRKQLQQLNTGCDEVYLSDVINEVGTKYSNGFRITGIYATYDDYFRSTPDNYVKESDVKKITSWCIQPLSFFYKSAGISDKDAIESARAATTEADKCKSIYADGVYVNSDYQSGSIYIDRTKITSGTITTTTTTGTDGIYCNNITSPDSYSITISSPLQADAQALYNDLVKLNKSNTEKKGNNTMNLNSMFNVDFGKITASNIALSPYGIALRGEGDSRFRAFNKSKGELMDVTGMTFESEYLYKIPCALKDVKPGDIVINAGRYVMVLTAHSDNTFTVVDPAASEQKIAIAAKNMFGFDYMTKVFSPLDGLFTPSDNNPFGINPMMMLLMGDKTTDNNDLLMLMAMSGNMNMNSMLPYLLLSKDGNKDSMLPLMLIMSANNANPFTSMGLDRCDAVKPVCHNENTTQHKKAVARAKRKMSDELDAMPVPDNIVETEK